MSAGIEVRPRRAGKLTEQMKHAESRLNDALGFIDQTVYANEDSRPDLGWSNAEVLELLGIIRGLLVADQPR